jgi:hypothetical protein
MLRCLQNWADTHNRGGVFARLSRVLDIVCLFRKLFPRQGQKKMSRVEQDIYLIS